MDTSLSELTEKELLEMSNYISFMSNSSLTKEWYRRYGMNFPYRLTKWGEVLNCITLQVMKEENLDQFIRGQAHFVKLLDQTE